MHIKALFLDYNGVIICDRSVTYQSTCLVFKHFNSTPPTLEEWRSCAGSNYMEMYRKLGLPSFVTQKIQHGIRNKYMFENWGLASIRPHCADVLNHVRKMGLKTAIVSAETAPILLKRIKENGMEFLFDEIYTDASPKKEHLVRALDEFGLKAEEVLFVEDSAEGIRIGNELGLVTVAFLNETSYGFHIDLMAAEPKFSVTEISDLVGIVYLKNYLLELAKKKRSRE